LVQAQRAQVWADLGERDHAAHAVGEGERLAATLTDPGEQAEVLADLAETLVRTGDPVRGEEIAAAIEDDHLRAITFARLVVIGGGRTPASADRSESAARSITGPDDRVEWLIRMAEIWTAGLRAGPPQDAVRRRHDGPRRPESRPPRPARPLGPAAKLTVRTLVERAPAGSGGGFRQNASGQNLGHQGPFGEAQERWALAFSARAWPCSGLRDQPARSAGQEKPVSAGGRSRQGRWAACRW
jgi:hypothetical protein